jgi:hypothetical protein
MQVDHKHSGAHSTLALFLIKIFCSTTQHLKSNVCVYLKVTLKLCLMKLEEYYLTHSNFKSEF